MDTIHVTRPTRTRIHKYDSYNDKLLCTRRRALSPRPRYHIIYNIIYIIMTSCRVVVIVSVQGTERFSVFDADYVVFSKTLAVRTRTAITATVSTILCIPPATAFRRYKNARIIKIIIL